MASYEQLVNSQPNGSARPGTVARLAIPAGASLRTHPVLQLGTATQRNYAAALHKAQLQLGTAEQNWRGSPISLSSPRPRP